MFTGMVRKGTTVEERLEAIRAAIWNHDAKTVKALVEKAVAEGIDVAAIVNDGLVGGMNALGEKFKAGEVFIPEILVSARAMAAGMAVVKPLLIKAGIREKGTLVIGTVQEDLHDIGKNLVVSLCEGSGFKVFDLGVNVAPAAFSEAIERHRPDVVGLSALLTTTMNHMAGTTASIKERYPGVKVIVGGAPVTQKFADAIGADAYARDAAVAIEILEFLLSPEQRPAGGRFIPRR
jgi:5-methyltetrahydrofolate--homocysteine methyltransferase